jgi:hypothetical protein
MGGDFLTPEGNDVSTVGSTAKCVPTGDDRQPLYGDVAWLGAGLALTACVFVLTGSAAAQAVAILGYLVAGALIGARRKQRTDDVTRTGHSQSAGQIVCLLAAGVGVYLCTRYVVQFEVGPWFTWWLALGSGLVIFRRWSTRASSKGSEPQVRA